MSLLDKGLIDKGLLDRAIRNRFPGLGKQEVVEEEKKDMKDFRLYDREGKFYVLVVNPDTEEAEEIKQYAEDCGCVVTIAPSAIEGLVKISHDMYDLIIVAGVMPRMDGMQFYRNIKASKESKCRDSKAYVILGDRATDKDEAYKETGFNGIIRRPIDRMIIMGAIVENANPKMIPDDDAELVEDIKAQAAITRVLQECNVSLSEGLARNSGDLNEYKSSVEGFIKAYESMSYDLLDYLYAGRTVEYMNGTREMRERSRDVGASYLSDCFDDHVNMAKEDSLEIAEINWKNLMMEWERVVSGLALWLGKSDVFLQADSVINSKTNGIRLSNDDIKDRLEELQRYHEQEEYNIIIKKLHIMIDYELDVDLRLKLDRVCKSYERGRYDTAYLIIESIKEDL